MNCGVVKLKDPCDTDPNKCKINQLCEKATLDKEGTKTWNIEAEAYVVVAKEYGLSCDVVKELKVEADRCKGGDTKSVKCRPIPIVPSDKETQVSGGCSISNLQKCTDTDLCKTGMSNGGWITSGSLVDYVNEAKRRGLTCGFDQKSARN